MRKSSKILLGVFCAGFLVAGIGTGVAFAEFSALEYDGQIVSYEEEATEHVINIACNDVTNEVCVDALSRNVTVDPALPAGTIQVHALYADRLTEFEVFDDGGTLWERGENDYFVTPEISHTDTIYLDYYCFYQDDFKNFWDAKDLILEGLKEGKLIGYNSNALFDVWVTVSPDMEKRVI